jgi:hypothetical protein
MDRKRLPRRKFEQIMTKASLMSSWLHPKDMFVLDGDWVHFKLFHHEQVRTSAPYNVEEHLGLRRSALRWKSGSKGAFSQY